MQVSENFENIGLSPIVEISERAKANATAYELKTQRPFIYFQRGEVGFDTPKYITQAIQDALGRGMTKYPKSGGEGIFKGAVINYMKETYDVDVGPSNILATYGGQEGLQLAFSMFRGKKVLGFGPCWSCMLENIWPYTDTKYSLYNLSPHNNFEIDFTAFEAALKLVDILYLNTPHNPTGKVFTDKELDHINTLCRRHDVFIISDEAYADITFDGRKHTSMVEFTNPDIMSIFTFSKSFAATGLRAGYTVCRNKELIQYMTRGNYTQTAGVVTPIQVAFATALNSQSSREAWFAYYLSELRGRRDALYNGLKDKFNIAPPEGAFYCFIDLNEGFKSIMDADKDKYITDYFMENGIAIVPGSAFGKDYVGHIRLSFSTLNESLIKEGTERLISLLPS